MLPLQLLVSDTHLFVFDIPMCSTFIAVSDKQIMFCCAVWVGCFLLRSFIT